MRLRNSIRSMLSSSGGSGYVWEKSKILFWNINPHTQHFVCRRIFMVSYPYSRLMDALFRISFPACDVLPLLVFKKSHSHPQWHHHTTFSSLPFHSSCLLPSLQFQTCFKVETLPTSQQRQQKYRIDGEGTLYSLTYHETSTYGILFLDIT